jgi:hypothetical protein
VVQHVERALVRGCHIVHGDEQFSAWAIEHRAVVARRVTYDSSVDPGPAKAPRGGVRPGVRDGTTP